MKKKLLRETIFFAVFVPLFFVFAKDAVAVGSTLEFDKPPYINGKWASVSVQDRDLFNKGYSNVNLYDNYDGQNNKRVDPTGILDSTTALQKAIDDSRDYHLVAFFPAGAEYLVSKTLIGEDNGKGTSDVTINLQGGTNGPRPIIRLKNNTFVNNANPQPIVAIYTMIEGDTGGCNVADFGLIQPGLAFNQFVRDIDFDMGSGNNMAAGLLFTAAQGSYIQNVKVYSSSGSSFYAGFYGLPGRSMGALNIEVEGGKYGVYSIGCDVSPIVVGAKLKNQETAAIMAESAGGPLVVIGFEIIKNSAPAIKVGANSPNGLAGTLSLNDGKIEIATVGSNPAIDNTLGQKTYFRNVYIKGTDNLVKSGTDAAVTGTGVWKKINEYSFCDKDLSYKPSYNLINGVKNKDTVISQEAASAAPNDLIGRHLISQHPSFEDSGVLNVETSPFGANGKDEVDDTAAIQAAIDYGGRDDNKVFLPKGNYRISGTLTLRKNTKFFGASNFHSRLFTSLSWSPGRQVPMVTTVNDSSATTYLGDIRFGSQINNLSRSWFNQITWKAGRNSAVKATEYMVADAFTTLKETNSRQEYVVTGNGGGKWYFINKGDPTNGAGSVHPDYRMFLVDGTSEPFTFYGLNPEHAYQSPYVEIKNSQNVRIYGLKVEGSGYSTVLINNSKNVYIVGHRSHLGLGSNNYFFKVTDSVANGTNNVVIAIGGRTLEDDDTDRYAVYESLTGKSPVFLTVAEQIALYKRGSFSDAPFYGGGETTPPVKPTGLSVR